MVFMFILLCLIAVTSKLIFKCKVFGVASSS